jgi:hypothetical protein
MTRNKTVIPIHTYTILLVQILIRMCTVQLTPLLLQGQSLVATHVVYMNDPISTIAH